VTAARRWCISSARAAFAATFLADARFAGPPCLVVVRAAAARRMRFVPLRTVILRLMLWSLGLAALTGALTIFFQSGKVIWRILGTELCTAFAAALILSCIQMIDRARSRAAGLVGMGGVLVEFLLALALIWEVPRALADTRCAARVAATMLVLGCAVLAFLPLSMMRHQEGRSTTARVGLAVIVSAALAFLLAIWLPSRLGVEEELAVSGAAIVTMGAIVSVCLVGWDGTPRRSWRWFGVACSGVAALLWFGEIWIGAGSDLGFVVFTGLVAGGAAVAYANCCLLCPLKPSESWFRGATIIAGLLTACLVELLMLSDRGFMPERSGYWFQRGSAAAGIVTACGTLALAVLATMNRRVEFEPDSHDIADVDIVCPRCRKRQTIRLGDAACAGCGLRISIRVEEPRCQVCEYLLVGLTSDRCPECGTPVTA